MTSFPKEKKPTVQPSMSTEYAVTDQERLSIRSFCSLNLRKKSLDAKFKERSRDSRSKIADSKTKLEKYMRDNGLTHATALSENGQQLFMTLLPTSSHRRIDANVVGFGLEAFEREVNANSEEYTSFDSPHEMLEQVIESVSNHIVTQRRTEQDKFKIANKRPKKLGGIAFEDISKQVESVARSYSRHTIAIQKWRETKKKEVAEIDAKLDIACPNVMSFLDNQNITSQKVTLGGANNKFFVRKKISRTTPPITNKDIKEIVRAAVTQASAENDFDTVDDVLRGDILREAILHQMKVRPKKKGASDSRQGWKVQKRSRRSPERRPEHLAERRAEPTHAAAAVPLPQHTEV